MAGWDTFGVFVQPVMGDSVTLRKASCAIQWQPFLSRRPVLWLLMRPVTGDSVFPFFLLERSITLYFCASRYTL